MWKKAVLIVSLALNVLLVSYLLLDGDMEKSHEPQARFNPYIHGFVPDSLTAVRIATAVWLPIYGEDVFKEEPFVALLVGDTVWQVSGSEPEGSEWSTKRWGVVNATIRKSDAKIIEIIHGK